MLASLKQLLKRALQRHGYELFRRPWLPRGVDPWETIHVILPGWNPSLALDIGANDGVTSLTIARHFPSARVHAFEPVSGTFRILVSRTENVPSITSHRLALGSKPGSSTIRLCKESTLNSLRNDLQPSDESPAETIETSTVDLFCSAHDISRINILKSDTEGFEIEVLLGANRLLSMNAVDVILIEVGVGTLSSRFVPLNSIVNQLAPFGFLLVGLFNQRGWSHRNAVEFCDALFVKKSLLGQ